MAILEFSRHCPHLQHCPQNRTSSGRCWGRKGGNCQHRLPLWPQHPFIAAHLPLQLQGCICPRGSRGPEDHHSKAASLVWVWVSPFPLLLSCRGHCCRLCGTVCGHGLSSTLICALLAAVCWPGHPRQPGASGPASWLQDKRRLGCRMGLPHFVCAGWEGGTGWGLPGDRPAFVEGHWQLPSAVPTRAPATLPTRCRQARAGL